jgi:superfamily II DNA or RNA helicase
VGTPRPGTPVRKLPPVSRLNELAQAQTDEVVVGTVQAIEAAMRTVGEGWTGPFERVGLVIVDEGHYEPAPEWSRAIRQLQTPTVLLTATPFRNDLKTFQIADEHVYRFKHRDAEGDRFLRRPEFERIEVNGPTEFIDRLIQRTETLLGDSPDARIVVRCEREVTVRALAELLTERGQSAVGIHERFSPNDPEYLQRSVPSVGHPARYWVHQYKLIEGIGRVPAAV